MTMTKGLPECPVCSRLHDEAALCPKRLAHALCTADTTKLTTAEIDWLKGNCNRINVEEIVEEELADLL